MIKFKEGHYYKVFPANAPLVFRVMKIKDSSVYFMAINYENEKTLDYAVCDIKLKDNETVEYMQPTFNNHFYYCDANNEFEDWKTFLTQLEEKRLERKKLKLQKEQEELNTFQKQLNSMGITIKQFKDFVETFLYSTDDLNVPNSVMEKYL